MSDWGRIWRYKGKRGVSWRIRYQDATGRRVLETLGKEPEWNRKRAEAELRRRLVAVEQDGYRRPDRQTLTEFTATWLEDVLPARRLKHSTIENYRSTLRRHLLPALGHHKLAHLEHRPELIDRYIATKLGDGLSPKTVHNHLLILSVVLKTAARRRLITRNPVADAERPRVDRPDIHILSQAEIAELWAAYQRLGADAATPIEHDWWRLAQTLTFTALATGLRRGELLALTWRDVGLIDQRLTVRRAIVRGRFTTPKSLSSQRTIDLGPRTTQLLADHWQQCAYQADDALVFAHPERGTPVDPARLARTYLRPALTAAGIRREFRSFHDLRHTSLTHDAAAGNPHPYIQHRAGHSQSAITDRYIHAAHIAFPGAATRAEARLFGPT
jgi:integrase